eukprot:CCRYP_017607-RA/>CCRYP_017607-RA protein AED:0.38 eAED:1.00 QI:0/0/0/1/0/0/2/0/79
MPHPLNVDEVADGEEYLCPALRLSPQPVPTHFSPIQLSRVDACMAKGFEAISPAVCFYHSCSIFLCPNCDGILTVSSEI